ncbi:hypothetical protein [Brevundimonas aurifodinae]|uniref:Aldose 1-epimerase n=1 Tax=Brevundimonas aurifodinae TaxID=1508312 RepID=A0ABV1NNC4_9CAUL
MADVHLARGDMNAIVRPELGGSLLGVWQDVDGFQPLLRSQPDPGDPRQAALFPMVPWANRIFDGGFEVGGERVRLDPLGPGPHVHGYGWVAPWSVKQQTASEVALVHAHASPGGYEYEAQLIYRLVESGLAISLSATNMAARPMPFGLGLHPYFERHDDTWLEASVQGVWRADEGSRPLDVEVMPPDLDFARTPLPTRFVDALLVGWNGRLHVGRRSTGSVVTLHAAECDLLHLYAPLDARSFCCEPVTHAVDAHNHGRMPAPVLATGEMARLDATLIRTGG